MEAILERIYDDVDSPLYGGSSIWNEMTSPKELKVDYTLAKFVQMKFPEPETFKD